MKVAVLGAAGGMGSFFARYFVARGHTVSGSDLRKPDVKGVRFCSTNADAVEGADVTFIAAPMEKTVAIARQVAKSLKRGSMLVEMCSVKGPTLPEVKRDLPSGVKLLSIHPLFGPALEKTDGMKIAVVCGRRGKEADAAARLFPEARIVPMSLDQHERTMAVVLSLTHIMNLVYAKTAQAYLEPEEFARASTPNSSMQLALAEAVLAQDPRLSYAIQRGNRYTASVAKKAMAELRRAIEMVQDSDRKGFEAQFKKLAERYDIKHNARAAIREVYSAAEKAA